MKTEDDKLAELGMKTEAAQQKLVSLLWQAREDVPQGHWGRWLSKHHISYNYSQLLLKKFPRQAAP